MAIMKQEFEGVSFSAIIPAAGYSSRMGSDKALLVYKEGESFASHLVNSYSSAGANPVVMIMNQSQDPAGFSNEALIRVTNKHVDFGRSYSIFIGMKQVPDGNACFIQNIDNPFIEPHLLGQMITLIESDGYVTPEWEGQGGHPVLLGSGMVRYIRGMETFPDFRDVLKRFNRIALPYPDKRILWNINDPGEYAGFLKIR